MPDSLRVQADEREKLITVNLVRCFDTMNTFGADPESLKSRQIVFSKVLSGYSPAQVESAFQEYFETGKGLPEPSDILKIIRSKRTHSGPAYKVFDPRKEETHPGYFELSEIDRTKIEEQLQKAKAALRTEKPKQEKFIPSHFESMSAGAQAAARDLLKNTKIAQTSMAKGGE